MAGYGLINQIALKETASAKVFEKLVQGILHVNGKGVDESYINGSALGSQSIAIPHVALGGGAFRKLGSSVNGGMFNGNDANVPTSDYFYVPLTFVYDQCETLAKIMNDKAGYSLLENVTDNITRKIQRGINALTFAEQISATLNESINTGSATYITDGSTSNIFKCLVEANAKLDEGDESIGADYFPTENRQIFFRPSAFASLKTSSNGQYITQSNLGQTMLATGVLNPFKDSEATKVDMRDGYCGEIDGVPCYKVSPILLKLAAGYCQKAGATITDTSFDGIEAIVCSSIGTIRGFTSTGDIEVVPATKGQGWILQPLVHGGCKCISPKSVRLIVKNGFTNPATKTENLTVLPTNA